MIKVFDFIDKHSIELFLIIFAVAGISLYLKGGIDWTK